MERDESLPRAGSSVPGLSEKYRQQYGNAYEVNSPDNAKPMNIFHMECEKYGVIHDPEECFRYIADLPESKTQFSLFDQ